MSFSDQLLNQLNKVEAKGTFVSVGAQKTKSLNIEIKDLGELSFPLNKIQIESIKRFAHHAPFGKGSQTIVDTTVRNCFEIDAEDIILANSNWQNELEAILKKIKPELGLEDKQIQANLYKMLIYEEGSFFLPHIDSEKEKGMFGTLVIGLPAKHTGGEFVISFGNEQKTVSFEENCKTEVLPYIAFYADCTHEIKPVTSGYRVCLVYNLINVGAGNQLHFESSESDVQAIFELLIKNENVTKEKPYILLLGHQYTPENFSFESLKLADRTKAEVFFKAAEKAGFYTNLALVTSYQMGQLESDYSPRFNSRYDSWDDDIDVDTASMGEVYDDYLEISVYSHNNLPTINGISIDDNNPDIIYNIELNDGEPIDKFAEGYTGNAGMTMEYWYHYGAIVFWSKKNHFKILEKCSTTVLLEWLAYYSKKWDIIKEEDKKDALSILNILSAKTAINDERTYSSFKEESIDYSCLIDFLIVVNKQSYVLACKDILFRKIANIDPEKWITLFMKFPDFNFGFLLNEEQLSKIKNLITFIKVCSYLEDDSFSEIVNSFSKLLLSVLEKMNLSDKKRTDNIAFLDTLIVFSERFIANEEWIDRIAGLVTKNLNREFVNDILIKTILDFPRIQNTLGTRILSIAINDLEIRVNNEPQYPKDWTKEVPKNTNYKAEWDILASFLQSPTETIFDYRAVQNLRSRMESAIANVTIDLDKETIRKGSPHILRLTKNTKQYHLEMKLWKQDCELLKEVKKATDTIIR